MVSDRHAWYVLPLQHLCDITSILFCRLINVNMLTVLTIFKRFMTETHDNGYFVLHAHDQVYI